MKRQKNRSIMIILLLLISGLFLGRMSDSIGWLFKGIGIVLGVVLAGLIALFLVAYLKRDKALAALNDCDPETAIAINERKIETLKAKPLNDKRQFQLNVRLNNLAVAYHATGDLEKAVEILKQVDAPADPNKHSIYVITYHNMAYYTLELGRMEEYEDCYNGIMDFLAELPADTAKQYGGVFQHLEAKKEMLEGNYEKCLDYYASSVEEEDTSRETLLSRVITRFELGMIYKTLGETESAREQLTFVDEHGKNIDVAKQAREALRELDEE